MALQVGERVEITGCLSPGGHKGKKGVITQFVDAENPAVKLDDGQVASFYKADVTPASAVASLKVGQRVEIQGSLTPGGHKGKKGTIEQFVDAENPAVRLDDGQIVSFYRADVAALPEAGATASGSLGPGSKVEISGSLTPGGHKGKRGEVTRIIDADGNLEVRLDSGQLVSFYKADVQAASSTALIPAAPATGALKVGSKVEIIGTLTPGGHKGKKGEITRFIDADNNPEVRLENGQLVSFYKADVRAVMDTPAAPLASAANGSGGLKVGSKVEIIGSLTPGGHKGSKGEVVRFIDADNNMEIRLESGQSVSFYKADVRELPASATAELKVGSKVEIIGSLTPGGHKGKKGEITRFIDANNNPEVRLESGQLVSFYKQDVKAAEDAPALKVGSKVEIVGSLTPGMHKGKKGEITRFIDANNNPEVRLESGQLVSFYKDDVKAVAAAAPLPPNGIGSANEPLKVGSKVEIVGSMTPGGHKGKKGEITRFIDANNNPEVRLESGQLVSFYKDDVKAAAAVAPLAPLGGLPEPLKVGSKVEIVGSMTPGMHKGKKGEITRFIDANNNPEVRLESGQLVSFYKDDVKALPAAAPLPPPGGLGGIGGLPEPLKVGSKVEIVGSMTPGMHKGKKGEITRFIDANNNPEVRLESGQLVSFYKADVRAVASDALSVAGAGLKVGQRVEIIGSLTPGGHKGKSGQITRFVDAENPEVKLDDGTTASFYKADVRALPALGGLGGPAPPAPLGAPAALKVGMRVEITGSLTPGGHKGKKGEITQFVDAENPAVKLDDGQVVSFYKADVSAAAEEPAIGDAGDAEALKVGCRVEIIGSLTPGGHKGKKGQVMQFVDAENPSVRLDDGQTVSFYKADVRVLPSGLGGLPKPDAPAALKVGLRVEIVGSLTPGGHKGKKGQITRFVDAENPEVRLEDGTTVSFYKADVKAASGLDVGSRVEITGSLTPGGHKGKKGTITRFVDAENPEVRLDDGLTVSFYRADVSESSAGTSSALPGSPLAPLPKAGEGLKVGQRVDITGSLTPGGHKGKKGTITQFVDAENPAVRLDDGTEVSFYKADVTPAAGLQPLGQSGASTPPAPLGARPLTPGAGVGVRLGAQRPTPLGTATGSTLPGVGVGTSSGIGRTTGLGGIGSATTPPGGLGGIGGIGGIGSSSPGGLGRTTGCATIGSAGAAARGRSPGGGRLGSSSSGLAPTPPAPVGGVALGGNRPRSGAGIGGIGSGIGSSGIGSSNFGGLGGGTGGTGGIGGIGSSGIGSSSGIGLSRPAGGLGGINRPAPLGGGLR